MSALRTRWRSGPFPLPTVSVVSSETYVLEEPPGTGLRFLRLSSHRGIPYILGSQGLGGLGGWWLGARQKVKMCSLFRGMWGPMPSDPSHTHPCESTPDPDFKADKASRPWALLCEHGGVLCRALGWDGVCP